MNELHCLLLNAPLWWHWHGNTLSPYKLPLLRCDSFNTNSLSYGSSFHYFFLPLLGFNSLVGGIMGFSILLSAEVFKHNSSVWFLDGSIGVLIGLTIFAYGVK